MSRLPYGATLEASLALARLPVSVWLKGLPMAAVVFPALLVANDGKRIGLSLLLYAVAEAYLAVAVTEQVLGFERGSRRWWGGAESRTLLRFLLLLGGTVLLTALIVLAPNRLVDALLGDRPSVAGGLLLLAWNLLAVVPAILALRLSLALPGALLPGGYGFRQSWRDTGPLIGPLLGLSVTVTLAWLLGILISLPYVFSSHGIPHIAAALLATVFFLFHRLSATVLLALALKAARGGPVAH